jgi:hypothetical protein
MVCVMAILPTKCTRVISALLRGVRGLHGWWRPYVLTIIYRGIICDSLLLSSYKGSPKSRELQVGVSVMSECLA